MDNKKGLTIIIIGVLVIAGAILVGPGLIGQVSTPEPITAADTPTAEIGQEEPQSGEVQHLEAEPEENQQVLPTPRQELVSTDPESVVLAAGKVQLVELFAFW